MFVFVSCVFGNYPKLQKFSNYTEFLPHKAKKNANCFTSSFERLMEESQNREISLSAIRLFSEILVVTDMSFVIWDQSHMLADLEYFVLSDLDFKMIYLTTFFFDLSIALILLLKGWWRRVKTEKFLHPPFDFYQWSM